MAESTLKAVDAVNGSLGWLTLVIDGESIDAGYCKNLTITGKVNKRDIKVLGTTKTKKKSAGIGYDGKMEIYYCTSKFTEILDDYAENGVETKFKMIIENDDPSSTVGTQRVVVNGCTLTEVEVAKLDVDSTELTSSISFDCERAYIDEAYDEPTLEA